MKKILHLTHTDIASDSRVLKEMGALVAAGYKVNGVGVALNEGAHQSSVQFESQIKSIKTISRKLLFLPRTLRHIASLIELVFKMLPYAIWQRPNVVHCHDTLVLPLGVVVKLLTGAKLVYDAHELESDRNGLSRMQGALTFGVEKLLWRFVDALIVVSPSIESWYRERFGPKPTAVILNSPLISQAGTHNQDYLREVFSIPKQHKIFIYVGILARGRGIDLLTEAFSAPDVSSHIVFMGYGDLGSELKHKAAEYPNIHVHAAVPHAQVVSIVQSADFGLCLVQNVSLSDYYCLPNKLFEYCFAGIPVLASDFPDISAVISEYGIGQCCKLDVDSIRGAIRALESSKVSFRFSDLYPLSWQAQEHKLLTLYQQAL
ncbi:glycosyltransferase [Pseudomonas mosselii]|uniref:glycosyltransferase n=1 Tax=Pseudomonas mosselii TaxID=78327 RepID=UPI0007826B01|nr:glycosyltransferase [Pseudomonas mosselii]MCH7418398.1 glycosyltransferase [Pseudomonas mosselii]